MQNALNEIKESYKIQRNFYYDFNAESYSSLYPNMHPYPATMLPQIGVGILQELNIKKENY